MHHNILATPIYSRFSLHRKLRKRKDFEQREAKLAIFACKRHRKRNRIVAAIDSLTSSKRSVHRVNESQTSITNRQEKVHSRTSWSLLERILCEASFGRKASRSNTLSMRVLRTWENFMTSLWFSEHGRQSASLILSVPLVFPYKLASLSGGPKLPHQLTRRLLTKFTYCPHRN